MKKSQFWAFTLIEFMVAITIFVIISLMAFAPYSYYINKTKVKNTGKEVTQMIYEAKNMAFNGVVGNSGNISVWVYFDSDENNLIRIIPFDHSIHPDDMDSGIVSTALANDSLLELRLQPGVQFDAIGWEDKWLIYFQSINGESWVFTWNWFQENSDENIEIDFSFKWATWWPLTKKIKYIQKTQIVDY